MTAEGIKAPGRQWSIRWGGQETARVPKGGAARALARKAAGTDRKGWAPRGARRGSQRGPSDQPRGAGAEGGGSRPEEPLRLERERVWAGGVGELTAPARAPRPAGPGQGRRGVVTTVGASGSAWGTIRARVEGGPAREPSWGWREREEAGVGQEGPGTAGLGRRWRSHRDRCFRICFLMIPAMPEPRPACKAGERLWLPRS